MRSEDKARRVRRKLEALTQAGRVGSAVATAHAAYLLCARRTSDPKVAVAAQNAASSLEASFGVSHARLGDRLRLEWLASLPNAEASLLAECARVLGDAIALSGPRQSDRIRLASAEAYSLAQAVSRGAVEAAWRGAPGSVAFLSFAR